MQFNAPAWLFALLPWAAVTLWLLWGRRTRAPVPFLPLWEGPVQPPRATRAIQPPPLALAMALLAVLSALLAAARPMLGLGVRRGHPLSIVLDRGMTASARGVSGPRFRELATRLGPMVAQQLGDGPVKLIPVPGKPIETNRASWVQEVDGLPPTMLDTTTAMATAVDAAVRESPGGVLVLTDLPLRIEEPRVARCATPAPIADIGIVHIAARQSPVPQLLVRISNRSAKRQTLLRLGVDGRPASTQPIDLPPAGQAIDCFVDLPGVSRSLTASLDSDDDLPGDNSASLVRESLWPKAEAREPLPVELERLVARYASLRPSTTGSSRVLLARSAEAVPVDQPAIILASPPLAGPTTAARNPIISAHPVMESLEGWSPQVSGNTPSPPEGPEWKAVLRDGERVLIAVRETPVRQVWTAVPIEPWATTPAFVVFWTNAITWAGQGADAWAAHPVAPLPSGWTLIEPGPGAPQNLEAGLWPGIYRRSDGVLRAVNAPSPPGVQAPPADAKRELSRLADLFPPVREGHDATVPLLFIALGALLLAGFTWRTFMQAGPSNPARNVSRIEH